MYVCVCMCLCMSVFLYMYVRTYVRMYVCILIICVYIHIEVGKYIQLCHMYTVYIVYNLVCSKHRDVSYGKPSKNHPQFRFGIYTYLGCKMTRSGYFFTTRISTVGRLSLPRWDDDHNLWENIGTSYSP